MTRERAQEINSRLTMGWFIIRRIVCDRAMPCMRDVTLNEAFEASRIIQAAPRERTPDGATLITASVELSDLTQLFIDMLTYQMEVDNAEKASPRSGR